MKRSWFIAAALVAGLVGTSARAAAMWEIASYWRCTMDFQLVLVPGMRPDSRDMTGRFYDVDFRGNTMTSAFVDGTAEIVSRNHFTNSFGDVTLLVKIRDGNAYPQTFVQGAGGFVTSSVSASDTEYNAPRWNVVSTCRPAKPRR